MLETINKKELKIDDTLDIGYIKVIAKERGNKHEDPLTYDCGDCAFYNILCGYSLKIAGSCNSKTRSDGKDIIFLEYF